ncbi:hypothetical protein BD410DRAFT_781314 [Rickenella mellea]|uniref:Uncharacterized protein n=1 Tax=Rickenella mellea TaxID=50990 RepID=A0A4Y7QNF7_9AGAM|nr:hypothetical protein BD410DRAFT_781314 [Rickenella mellea]
MKQAKPSCSGRLSAQGQNKATKLVKRIVVGSLMIQNFEGSSCRCDREPPAQIYTSSAPKSPLYLPVSSHSSVDNVQHIPP